MAFDYKSTYYCHWLFALLEPDLAYILANFASNILEAMQILETHWRELIQDIEKGEINKSLKLDPVVRTELNSYIQSNPSYAKKLKFEFEKGFFNIVPRLWENLSYIGCITTGSMQIYKDKIKYYIGEIPIYSHGYGASEAYIGVNLEPEKDPPVYTITPHAAFFEFISVEEIDSKNPQTIELASLKIGKIYEIVITNIAGLYRYRLGDVVKCVGYYNKTPKIEFLYRRGALLNLKGEKVSENIVSEAIIKATQNLNNTYQLIDYTTTLKHNSQPWNYVFYVEMNKNFQSLFEAEIYRDSIEKTIGKLNNSYLDKRKTGSIGEIKLNLVKQHTFKKLKEKLITKSNSDSQFKMPRVLKDKLLIKFLDELTINSI